MRTRRWWGALAAASFVLAACGDDSGETGSGGASGNSTGASPAGGTSASNASSGTGTSTGTGTGAGTGTGGGAGGEGGGGTGGASDLCGPVPEPDAEVGQALPERWVDTTLVTPTGATIAVAAGDDLQAAIDAAEPGDVIELEAGATFSGSFTLPNKGGSDWITIRTATPDDAFVAAGTRAVPADAPLMAKISAPNALPGLSTAPGAHHFRIIGIEVTPVDADALSYTLVQLGDGSSSDPDGVPHHIILDRVYVHGTPTGYAKRGVGVDCSDCAVIDSTVADCHAEGQDAQAIAGFNGPGPIAIVNNFLEGSGENVMFGGADSAIDGLVPSDIEIRRNHFFKPLSWKVDDPSYAGIHWSVKNLFELKNAARVLIQCNVLENNWADAQVGFAVLFTPRNQDGGAPWSGVSDVTFQDNVLRHTASGFNVAGEDDLNPSTQTARIVVKNNLIYDVSRPKFGGDGRVYQIVSPGAPVVGIKVAHNTSILDGNAALMMADGLVVAEGFIFRDNVLTRGEYGLFGSGQGEGTSALDFYVPGYVVESNVLVGAAEAIYPAGNFFPATVDEVGFADAAADDYALEGSSAYAGAASDGSDLGADVVAIEAKTAGVVP